MQQARLGTMSSGRTGAIKVPSQTAFKVIQTEERYFTTEVDIGMNLPRGQARTPTSTWVVWSDFTTETVQPRFSENHRGIKTTTGYVLSMSVQTAMWFSPVGSKVQFPTRIVVQ